MTDMQSNRLYVTAFMIITALCVVLLVQTV